MSWWQNRGLNFKAALGITLTLVVVLGAVFIGVSQYTRARLWDSAIQMTENINAIAANLLQDAMLAGHKDTVQEALSRFGQSIGNQQLDSIAVYNNQYQLSSFASGFSGGLSVKPDSMPTNIQDPSCWGCHQLPPGERPTHLVMVVDGREVIRNSVPLYNEPRCQTCHGTDAKLNGDILVDYSEDQFNQSYATIALGLGGGIIVAIGLVVLVLYQFIRRIVLRPVEKLGVMAEAMSHGSLEQQIEVRSSDEIGILGRAFNSMASQLRELIGSLEKRVEARTDQLRTSAEVGRAAASILDTERLLREIVNLITDRFGFYYSAIFLNDERNRFAVLHEATGEAGRTLKERQHKLEIGGQSMVSAAITTRRPRIALDTGAEPVRFANPLLPETRSEIALPLIVGDRTLGALDVQSTQASAFDETYASLLQSMADQIAIAVSNTQQFSQTEAALRQTNILYEAGRKIAVADNAAGILAAIITQAAPDADGSALILFGPIDQFGQMSFLESAAVYSDHPTDFKLLAGVRYQPEQLPLAATTATSEPIVIEDSEKTNLPLKQSLSLLGARAVISLPLTAGSQHIGTLILSYRQPRSFSGETVQILQALASQAAVAVHNQQLLAETQTTLKQLDAINRRLTGQAWRDYTMSKGSLQVVDAGPGVPAAAANNLSDSVIEADRVQVVGPIGDTRSGLIAPIALRGEVVGTLSLQEIDKDRVWTDNEIALLQTVANDVAVAIENARLIEQTERRAERERVISAVSTRMFAANDLQGIVQIAGDELARVLHVARTQVQIGGEYLQSTTDHDAIPERNGH
jgi:GAF domain-containing protein/HAMP domain-containing protein